MISLEAPSVKSGSTILKDLVPDLTPMLDVLFILLVFFMITAGAVFQTLDITLPSSVSEALPLAQQDQHILLEIGADIYKLDGKSFDSLETLNTAISQKVLQYPERGIVVAGDKTLPIEALLTVLTALQSRGIKTANILMKHESTP